MMRRSLLVCPNFNSRRLNSEQSKTDCCATPLRSRIRVLGAVGRRCVGGLLSAILLTDRSAPAARISRLEWRCFHAESLYKSQRLIRETQTRRSLLVFGVTDSARCFTPSGPEPVGKI